MIENLWMPCMTCTAGPYQYQCTTCLLNFFAWVEYKFGFLEGLVERVVLLGAPVSVQGEHWEAARKVIETITPWKLGFRIILVWKYDLRFLWESYEVLKVNLNFYFFTFWDRHFNYDTFFLLKMVAGRFINAYSTNDWILGITFRARLVSANISI